MKQIFISYAPRDRDYVATLREELDKIGYKAWVNREARAGQTWQYAVTEGIRASDALVVIMSANAADSIHVTYEWALALGAGIKVIAILFRGVNAHPHLMVQEQFDFGAYPDENQFWRQFCREIQRILGDDEKSGGTSTQALAEMSIIVKESGFFLTIERQSTSPKRIRLNEDSVSLGRDAVNDIQIDEAGVSRTHLRFVRTRNSYQVIDMGSTNGTFIGDDRIDSLELKSGDMLRIGDKIMLRFEYIP